LTSAERNVEKTPEPGIARRTSRAGKNVTPATTLSKKNTGKKPMYGPPRTNSKNVPASEQKKRSLKRKNPLPVIQNLK
ncbi:hypothetical protein A2U01_0082450, partial [Trifolium medium]|nr:hypothetical protein [Trifolium medium]